MEQYYTMENTTGYALADLDFFNIELTSWIVGETIKKGSELTDDEVNEIIKRHNDHVAQQ